MVRPTMVPQSRKICPTSVHPFGAPPMEQPTSSPTPEPPAETHPRRRVPLVLQGLWALVWALMGGVMLLSILLGGICFVVGLLSLVFDGLPLQLNLGGTLARTPAQKGLFAAAGAALALTGCVFWWLRRRGSTIGAVVLYLAVVLVIFVLAWVADSKDLISIGLGGSRAG